ncbi:BTB/POZ domain-containing protein 6-B-like [Sitodiplosis mosellana]|uniref:BTB/POZ domain-containing protein 6-B-like n=1 Tax=Sitodiplosis mosellana TaxID=263140 RepID=UPI0024447D6E|nr:BTB/POZ domain-containing protein 6-B-like [Sitodiplosis mosellana]
MTHSVFEVNNQLSQNNFEKFYLDSNSADVKFVFGADHVETVPAHKIILSGSSPTFNTMFYGSLPEQGDVPMDDTSAAVFKEFLQFFYLTTVRLTSEHIADVTNLCKKYEMVEALKLCEDPLQRSFTIDGMCSGYELAILLDLTDTIQFCEQKIIQHAESILKSTSFLECNRDLIDQIIQLVIPELELKLKVGSAWVIVNAYMAWTKAECERNNLEETTANLKAQLGQSLANIPFVDLNAEQFGRFIATYNGLLNESDLITIIQKTKKKQEVEMEMKNQADRTLICDRRYPSPSSTNYSVFISSSNRFTANKQLWLKEIYCARSTRDYAGSLNALIYRAGNRVLPNPLYLILISSSELHAVLEQPIQIDPQVEYEVEFSGESWAGPSFKLNVQMGDGYEIKFSNNGSISQLVFLKPDA